MAPDAESTPPDAGSTIEPASRPPNWALRIVNPLLAVLLRSPLHGLVSDDLVLLTVTGRRSGREYTFPVAYDRDDGTVRVTSFGTTWWKNLRDGGQEVTLHLRGERRTGHATVEEDDGAVAAYVHDYLERNGTEAAGQVGLELPTETVPSVEELEAAVGHVVVVTIDLRDA